jgi:predicted ATP-grasp superfamily ATP-dependent carboligase
MTIDIKNQIVFLGAGFRTTMAQIFINEIQNSPGLGCDILSVESPFEVIPPIGDYMPIVVGPKFDSEEFSSFLSNRAKETRNVLFIPFMDSACRALSKWGVSENARGRFTGSPNSDILSDKYFLQKNLPIWGISTPQFTGNSDHVIIKPRFGFGSRGIEKMRTSLYLERTNEWDSNSVVQDFITGPEVSIDVYVSKTNEYSAISRERIRVSDGEVLETKTRNLDRYEKGLIDTLANKLTMRGPINIQLIGAERLLLEINPRFSGGSTASITAGWNAPNWLISEYLLDEKVLLNDKFEHVHVIRSRRDHVRRIL